jgi:hypothetical protein
MKAIGNNFVEHERMECNKILTSLEIISEYYMFIGSPVTTSKAIE